MIESSQPISFFFFSDQKPPAAHDRRGYQRNIPTMFLTLQTLRCFSEMLRKFAGIRGPALLGAGAGLLAMPRLYFNPTLYRNPSKGLFIAYEVLTSVLPRMGHKKKPCRPAFARSVRLKVYCSRFFYAPVFRLLDDGPIHGSEGKGNGPGRRFCRSSGPYGSGSLLGTELAARCKISVNGMSLSALGNGGMARTWSQLGPNTGHSTTHRTDYMDK